MSEQVETETAKALAAVNGAQAIAANADAKVLSHDNTRSDFLLTNDGANDAWVSYGPAAAVAHQGHYLKAGGGVLAEDSWAGEVHAFSIGGTNVCFIDKSYAVGEDEGEQVAGAAEFVPSGPGDAPIGPSAPVVEHR